MKKTNYLILFLIIPVVIFINCRQKPELKKGEIYIANNDFGKVSNQIEKIKLDSLVDQLPYWRLSKFKTTNFQESRAFEILTTEIRTKGLNPNEFIIYEIKIVNDSALVFHLNHIDYYVYKHNLDKLNTDLSGKQTKEGFIEEIPPITGNISGHEGWYTVNIEKEKIQISNAQ